MTTTYTISDSGGGSLFHQLEGLAIRQNPELAAKVGKLRVQVAQGTAADDNNVAGLIDDLARGVPGANNLLKALMASPEASAAAGGPVTKFVLGRL